MKKLASILAGISMLFVLVANASARPHPNKLSKTDVVNMYIQAVTQGKTDGLDNILDDNIEYNMSRGSNVTTLNKSQLMSFFKSAPAGDSAVTATTTTVQDSDSNSVVKIQFKYPDFTRTDVVTLTKAGDWTITNVDTSSK